jgi:KaiC/GvpD/RAD55 family RecA-like ATPase
VKRVPTGIEGLDELIEGGIPQGSSVLVSGGSGTGKTIFVLQYLYEGALKYNSPGIYVTLETNLKNITWNMENFNWDIKKLQQKELFKIYKLNISGKRPENVEDQIYDELDVIAEMVEKMGAVRLAVDSTTALGIWIRERGALRTTLFEFTDYLKKLNCTTLLTSETSGEKNQFSAFGVEDFIADGIIALYFTPPHRSIFIRKMRGTNHSMSPHAFEISNEGIRVRTKEEILWESIK